MSSPAEVSFSIALLRDLAYLILSLCTSTVHSPIGVHKKAQKLCMWLNLCTSAVHGLLAMLKNAGFLCIGLSFLPIADTILY